MSIFSKMSVRTLVRTWIPHATLYVEIEVWVPQTISYSLVYPLNININFNLIGTLRCKIYPNVTKLGIPTYLGLLHVPAKFHP